MDILAQLMTGLRANYGPADDFWYRPVSGVTAAGLRVDAAGAQKISAWYRGRDILATSLAMLPLVTYRRLPDDAGRAAVPQHPLYDVLHRKPNGWQDSFQWRREAMYHLIDYGWAYADLVDGPRGFVDQLRPIHPTLVTPTQNASGLWVFTVRDPKTGRTTTRTQEDTFFLRGADGKGVLEYARDSLGLGLTLESYASKLFSRGTLTSGFIQIPGAANEGSLKNLAESYKTAMGDWHLPKVLDRGATFQSAMLDPEKAQVILSRKFTVTDIARWLGLPPHMLGDLDRATFSNVEHQGQEFVTYSLGPWLSLWEFAINDQLILRPETYYAEFVRDALVRGDVATRWEAYVKGTNAGIVAINEVRTKENLPKVPGGDVPREPANIVGNRRSSDGTPPARRARPAEDEDDQAVAIATAAAARLLRKEVKAVQRLAVRHAANQDAFSVSVTDFYAQYAALVADTLAISQLDADGYCASQAAQVVSGDWIAALETWQTDAYAAGVAALALEGA